MFEFLSQQSRPPADDDEIDPARLRVAVHELGHAIVWQVGWSPPRSIRVRGVGDRARGHVAILYRPVTTTTHARDYLAGVLAGEQADRRWCEHNGLTFHAYTCATDEDTFRWHRRHSALCRAVPPAEIRARAQHILRAHWPRICRLAPRLARTGRIHL